MCYTGSRPGIIVESRYIEVQMLGSCTETWRLHSRRPKVSSSSRWPSSFSTAKNRRHINEEQAYSFVHLYLSMRVARFFGVPRTKFFLHEIPSARSLCPVTYFLALAFADDVFEGHPKYATISATWCDGEYLLFPSTALNICLFSKISQICSKQTGVDNDPKRHGKGSEGENGT